MNLGNSYTKQKTQFKLWAPTAQNVHLKLYQKNGTIENYKMEKEENDIWQKDIEGNLHGNYYTYLVTIDEQTTEVSDPYAKACDTNGRRSLVIDLKKTNPPEWKQDKKPFLEQKTDAIIYQMHINDISSHLSSGIEKKGKFLGLMEPYTKNSFHALTGLDHIKELGITHIHLCPPININGNYNIPNCTYSSKPYKDIYAIKEFKKMVQTMHQNGIRVVMEVSYSYTYNLLHSNLNKIVPGYYYRKCKNSINALVETASERDMVQELIIDSVVYWAKEYHIDGFCFDFMALHDLETMKKINDAIKDIDETILIYGREGNVKSVISLSTPMANKKNIKKIPFIGMLSELSHDAIVGDGSICHYPGFVNGLIGIEQKVKACLVGGVKSELEISSLNTWTEKAEQSINYISDTLTVWDKIASTNPRAEEKNKKSMAKMAAALLFLSQGIPMLQAGEEFLRSNQDTKTMSWVNWDLKTENIDFVDYYKGLIAFRKEHPALRLSDKELIAKCIYFQNIKNKRVITFLIKKPFEQEPANYIWCIFNADTTSVSIQSPSTELKINIPWRIYINGVKAGTVPIKEWEETSIEIPARSVYVLCK